MPTVFPPMREDRQVATGDGRRYLNVVRWRMPATTIRIYDLHSSTEHHPWVYDGVMPDTNHHANPKARMGAGDLITAQLDSGVKITIMRTEDHYRVTMIDAWGRPLQEGVNFPGAEHHQERAARDHATMAYRQIYVENCPVTWIVYRAATDQRYVTHRAQTAQTRQLQLI
jgi:hypothetical protein